MKRDSDWTVEFWTTGDGVSNVKWIDTPRELKENPEWIHIPITGRKDPTYTVYVNEDLPNPSERDTMELYEKWREWCKGRKYTTVHVQTEHGVIVIGNSED